ncbi:isochorismatase family protein [Rhodobacteraceae bacterium B1Z28]|uniref:Isochorismatase family protein n=1 Tax=Ruegeria haliotis TaxID=2747601 RepID=A0ABX2PW62_9RHOB|nr:isochorismatase family protein [Ruegeria haliotis]NVO57347.1 isochorismatase family protein [Ruegeria haliotis]
MGLPQIAPYTLPQAADLPTPRAPFQLNPDRAALLVHDMQQYFCAPYPPDADPIRGVVANTSKILTAARNRDIPVFYTAQKGNQFRADRGLQADLWGPGMQTIGEHEEVLDQIAPQPDDIVLVKHRYSAFQRSNLETLMRARKRDQLVIVGVFAHIGCLATASEAFQLDIEPFAIADAQADFDRARHDMAMHWIAGCCGGVATTSTVLSAFTGDAK